MRGLDLLCPDIQPAIDNTKQNEILDALKAINDSVQNIVMPAKSEETVTPPVTQPEVVEETPLEQPSNENE